MKRVSAHIAAMVVIFFALSACAAYNAHKVGPTVIHQAKEEIPEDALMDVGIEVFQSAELSKEEAKDEGTTSEIRKAEGHYIPYHLKNTLQQSGHWGAVRMLPADSKGTDLLLRGTIIRSNGEYLVLKVEAVDASGNIWLNKTYEREAEENSYTDTDQAGHDPFQDLYNAVANDLAVYRENMTQANLRNIRQISKLQFASDFASTIFSEYLQIEPSGKITINRLPSDDDPMMARLLQIRERDHMYVDTLNEYYDGFYNEMRAPYGDWRKANQAEQVALRKINQEAAMKAVTGILLVAAGIALGFSRSNTGILPGLMVAGGTSVIVNGVNVSREAEIHRDAIKELSESFGSEMKPMVVEFQGKKYELTGSVEEQYKRWRKLLGKIYFAETGFNPESDAVDKRNPEHPKGN